MKRRHRRIDSTARARFGAPTRRAFALPAALAILALILCSGVGAAHAVRALLEPTREQRVRLYHLEPYIRYFAALEYGEERSRVPASYIRALILSESSADKFALSHAGARGLTQILPATGRMASGRLSLEEFDFRYIDERRLRDLDPDMLYDPAVNILIACYLNARYSARWSGRLDLMAAAWNAGPGAVLKYGNRLPPYAETQAFVERVLAYKAYFDNQQSS